MQCSAMAVLSLIHSTYPHHTHWLTDAAHQYPAPLERHFYGENLSFFIARSANQHFFLKCSLGSNFIMCDYYSCNVHPNVFIECSFSQCEMDGVDGGVCWMGYICCHRPTYHWALQVGMCMTLWKAHYGSSQFVGWQTAKDLLLLTFCGSPFYKQNLWSIHSSTVFFFFNWRP